MFASVVTAQLIFDGAVYGMVVGLIAVGIVLVYRSSKVINFAVGNMGLVGASLVAYIWVNFKVPFWLAALVGLFVGTLFGVVIERTVIRRLFNSPRVVVLVATIGISQLALAVISAFPKISDPGAPYPTPISGEWRLGSVRITGPQLTMLVVGPVVAALLGWFLQRTLLGRAVKASADNADLARLSGVNPKTVSTCVWGLAALIATIAMILIAGANGSAIAVTTLGASTLVRAMAAAAFARFASVSWALAAGVSIGVAQNVIAFNFLSSPGLIDFVLLVAVLVAISRQSRTTGRETRTFAFSPKSVVVPQHLRGRWQMRALNAAGPAMLLALGLMLPVVVHSPSRHLLYTVIVGFAICAISAVVLTGWAGQLSLGQMAFAGIGALSAAALRRGMSIDVGWRSTRFLKGSLPSMPFALAVVLGALVAALLAVVIGVGALRVQGLLLAVTTFAFAIAAQTYLYRRPIFTGGETKVRFPRGTLFGLDLGSRRTYYYAVLGALVVVVVVTTRLRRSGIGRTTIAARDNADSAAAYTVNVSATKLRAFGLAGGLAGLGGALLAGAVERVPTSDDYFLVQHSLLLISIVVIGGMGAPLGAVIGAVWVIGLPSFFPENQLVPLFTSSLGLLILLMYFPGGLVQISGACRAALVHLLERRLPAAPPLVRSELDSSVAMRPARAAALGGDGLEVVDASVSFGGIRAVDNVSLRVGVNEIVGLIGTNGAGKTTLMNAIGGFVPANGRFTVLGHDVGDRGAAERAGLGLGRTFQAAVLFPELTVRETVQVALESRYRTRLWSTALFLPHAIRRDRAQRNEADDLIGFLGLGRYADHVIAELSTGTRRIVELAGLLALDARVLCLDEPTAGLAQRETEAFGPLLQDIRRHLGAGVLLIEHDMPLVMGVSDRVYCLEAGRVIAEGAPSEVRHDPRVIASYLGTDERAVARSGAAANTPHSPQQETTS